MTGTELRLRARLRQRNDDSPSSNHHLFVRLAPSTAARLRDRAARAGSSTATGVRLLPEENNNNSTLLSSPRGHRTTGIEFLPLAITNQQSNVTVYASYNGGDATGEGENSTIELPHSLYCSLFLDAQQDDHRDDSSSGEQCIVSVKALAPVETAAQLVVEPVTEEDWELLQLDAAWLEGGGLLRQVSLVYPNQVVPLLLSNGSDLVRVRVVPGDDNVEPRPVGSSSVWPPAAAAADEGAETEWHAKNPHCLLLRADTEIVVTPKRRKKRADKLESLQLRTTPCRQDYTGAMLKLADLLSDCAPMVDIIPQTTVAVHPTTLNKLLEEASRDESKTMKRRGLLAEVRLIPTRGSAERTADSTELSESSSALVAVTESSAVSEDCIALHPLVRFKIKADRLNSTVSIRLLSEAEIRSARLRESEAGKSKFSFQKVKVQNTSNSVMWRSPDIPLVSCNGIFGVHSADATYDDEDAVSLDALSSLSSLGKVPMELGGLLYLSSTDCANSGGLLLRLEHNSDVSDQTPTAGKKFVFAQDLVNLFHSIQSPDNGELSLDIFAMGDGDTVVDMPDSSALAGLLPAETHFTATIHMFVESMARYSALFIHGERGTGKTQTALTVAAVAELTRGSSCAYLDCRKLRHSRTVRMKTILSEITQIFEDAKSFSCCVVILDDLDELIPSFGDFGQSDDSAQAQQVNPVEIDQAKLCADVTRHILRETVAEHNVTVIVTCQSAESLSTKLLADTGLSLSAFATPKLSPANRTALFRCMLQRSLPNIPWPSLKDSSMLENFGSKTTGFRPRDFEQLALRVCKKLSWHASDPTESLAVAVSQELETFVPLARLGIAEEAVTDTCWSDVGGLFQAKAALESAVLRPSLYRRIYESAKIRLPRGILLYGYPGNGKSMCVPALAKECGFPLIMCRGPELLDKYIGASEAKVRELFVRAASAAPSILFLDELDSLAPRRGSDHTGVTDRVVNQLLTFLDGVEDTSQSGQVYVIAATSRPDKVDPALLRPGRLEKHVFVGFAEDREEWTDLLTKISSSFKVDSETRDSIVSGRFMEEVERQSNSHHQLSAADLNAVFSAAQLAAVHEALAQGQINDAVSIRYEQLMNAFLNAKPSLSQSDYQQLRSVYSVYNHELLPQNAAADMASGSNPARNYNVEPQRIALR